MKTFLVDSTLEEVAIATNFNTHYRISPNKGSKNLTPDFGDGV